LAQSEDDFGSKFGQKTFQCTNLNPIVGLVIPFMEKLDWIGLDWVAFLIDPSRQRNSNVARP